jgi:hypothetical protein
MVLKFEEKSKFFSGFFEFQSELIFIVKNSANRFQKILSLSKIYPFKIIILWTG